MLLTASSVPEPTGPSLAAGPERCDDGPSSASVPALELHHRQLEVAGERHHVDHPMLAHAPERSVEIGGDHADEARLGEDRRHGCDLWIHAVADRKSTRLNSSH